MTERSAGQGHVPCQGIERCAGFEFRSIGTTFTARRLRLARVFSPGAKNFPNGHADSLPPRETAGHRGDLLFRRPFAEVGHRGDHVESARVGDPVAQPLRVASAADVRQVWTDTLSSAIDAVTERAGTREEDCRRRRVRIGISWHRSPPESIQARGQKAPAVSLWCLHAGASCIQGKIRHRRGILRTRGPPIAHERSAYPQVSMDS